MSGTSNARRQLNLGESAAPRTLPSDSSNGTPSVPRTTIADSSAHTSSTTVNEVLSTPNVGVNNSSHPSYSGVSNTTPYRYSPTSTVNSSVLGRMSNTRLEGKPKIIYDGKKHLDKFEAQWLRCLGQTEWKSPQEQVDRFRGFLSGSARTWWDKMDPAQRSRIRNGDEAISALRDEFDTSFVSGIVGSISDKKQKKKESEQEFLRRVREVISSWERRQRTTITSVQEAEICLRVVKNMKKDSKVRQALISRGEITQNLNELNKQIRNIIRFDISRDDDSDSDSDDTSSDDSSSSESDSDSDSKKKRRSKKNTSKRLKKSQKRDKVKKDAVSIHNQEIFRLRSMLNNLKKEIRRPPSPGLRGGRMVSAVQEVQQVPNNYNPGNPRFNSHPYQRKPNPNNNIGNQGPKGGRPCFICGRIGHFARECSLRNQQRIQARVAAVGQYPQRQNGVVCTSCGLTGHTVQTCRVPVCNICPGNVKHYMERCPVMISLRDKEVQRRSQLGN